MDKQLNRRVWNEGAYLADNVVTIRDVAKNFNISKSTVHKDLKERLPLIDSLLSARVNKVLQYNYGTKHIRGGEKTRQKYQSLK